MWHKQQVALHKPKDTLSLGSKWVHSACKRTPRPALILRLACMLSSALWRLLTE